MVCKSRAVEEARSRGLLDSKTVTLAEHYILERKEENVLGAGGYGVVWKGVDVRTNNAVAIKQVMLNYKTQGPLDRELNILKACEHKHILQLHAYGHDKEEGSVHFILELCDGNLDQFVKDKDIDVQTCLNYMRDICDGVEHLHNRKIVHRDLKPSNVLVNDNVLKVADFGLSKQIYRSDSLSPNSATPGTGTPGWMAPELCTAERKPKDDLSVDVFSLALLFLSLLVHQRGKNLTAHTGMSLFVFLAVIHIEGLFTEPR